MQEKMKVEDFREMIARKFSKPTSSANNLTKQIVAYMNMNGFNVWRQNNHATYDVRAAAKMIGGMIGAAILSRKRPTNQTIEKTLRKGYRKMTGKKGVPDVIGYHKRTGTAVYVEVKAGRDKLSPAQIRFLADASAAGCLAFEAKELEDVISAINLFSKKSTKK